MSKVTIRRSEKCLLVSQLAGVRARMLSDAGCNTFVFTIQRALVGVHTFDELNTFSLFDPNLLSLERRL